MKSSKFVEGIDDIGLALPSGAPLLTFSELYGVPVDFEAPSSSFEAVYCFICGRQRVAVAPYQMICLVLTFLFYNR